MSLETVLLLAFFILLPLIERLVRSARQRNKGTAVRPGGRPPSAAPTAIPGPQPPGDGQPRHPPLVVPPLPASARQAVSTTVAASVRSLAGDAGRRETSPPTAYERGHHRPAAAGLRSPLSLRRGIVLMTILEPCRATTPHEFPERDVARPPFWRRSSRRRAP